MKLVWKANCRMRVVDFPIVLSTMYIGVWCFGYINDGHAVNSACYINRQSSTIIVYQSGLWYLCSLRDRFT